MQAYRSRNLPLLAFGIEESKPTGAQVLYKRVVQPVASPDANFLPDISIAGEEESDEMR